MIRKQITTETGERKNQFNAADFFAALCVLNAGLCLRLLTSYTLFFTYSAIFYGIMRTR